VYYDWVEGRCQYQARDFPQQRALFKVLREKLPAHRTGFPGNLDIIINNRVGLGRQVPFDPALNGGIKGNNTKGKDLTGKSSPLGREASLQCWSPLPPSPRDIQPTSVHFVSLFAAQ
jgi:hypothetical protein